MAETAGSTVHHIADPEVATSARWPGWPMPTQDQKAARAQRARSGATDAHQPLGEARFAWIATAWG